MATSQHFANWVCGPKLLQIYLMYAFVTVRDSPTMSGEGSTVTTIYMPALKTLKIATPPISEQTEIVCRVETLFAFADRLEARLAQAQTAASRLTPELLAKAFRGELVPQDSNDEPAAELLRRLAETSAIPAKQGRVAKVI
jgi:type I restriction enzyme, S subunit